MEASTADAVLVVDDEPLILEVAAEAISARGLTVATAVSAEAALDLLRARSFGCMLVDKNMPGSNGLELIREAQKLHPDCACMVMTGYSSTQSAVEALRLGAVDYLTKPFESLPLVAEKVCRVIENNRARRERDGLLRRLVEFQAELSQRTDQVARQRTEIEMFNEILELRVEQATADLRRERDELLEQMSAGASHAMADIIGAEMALKLVQDIQLADSMEAAHLRGELQRVVRQLQSHIESLRKRLV